MATCEEEGLAAAGEEAGERQVCLVWEDQQLPHPSLRKRDLLDDASTRVHRHFHSWVSFQERGFRRSHTLTSSLRASRHWSQARLQRRCSSWVCFQRQREHLQWSYALHRVCVRANSVCSQSIHHGCLEVLAVEWRNEAQVVQSPHCQSICQRC